MNNLSGINEHLITLVKLGLTKQVARCPEMVSLPIDNRYFDYKLVRLAVQWNETGIVDLFIKHGFRVNPDMSLHEPADTPLHFAVERKNNELLRMLLQHYASVEHKNEHGLTALQTAVKLENGIAVDMIMYELKMRHYLRRLTKMDQLSTMHTACLSGDMYNFERILKCGVSLKEPVPLSSPIWPGCTNLHLAVIAKSTILIEFLVSNGIDTESRDVMNLTALQLAVKTGSETLTAFIIRFYIDHNVGLRETDSDGMTLLHRACALTNTNLKLSHDLVRKGANVHAKTNVEYTKAPGYTPLHFACKSGGYSNVRVLIEHGADPSMKNANGETPIHLIHNRPDIMMECFKNYNKFRIDTKDQFGTSHFHLACLYGHVKLVNEFLNRDKWINYNERVTTSPSIIAHHGSTPLHLAVRPTTKEVSDQLQAQILTRLLLCENINANIQDCHGQTALHIAIESGNKPLATGVLISTKKVNVNAVNYQGQTALHLAVQKGYMSDQINTLIYAKANLLAKDSKDQTPIHLAHKKNIAMLLHAFTLQNNYSSSRNPSDRYGRSIFDIACENYETPEARYIVNRFLETCVKDKDAAIGLKRIKLDSEKALLITVKGQYITTVKALLRLGLVNINDRDARGCTALHIVASDDSVPKNGDRRREIAAILIANGINTEATLYDCRSTALHWAVRCNPIGMVEMLMQKQTNLSPRNQWQNTPLHIAAQNCNVEVVRMLIDAGVDVNEYDDIGCTALHKIADRRIGTSITIDQLGYMQWTQRRSIKQYMELIELLLYAPTSHGNIDVKNKMGWTPLCIAYGMNNPACTKAFLEHGANPENAWHRMVELFAEKNRHSGPLLLLAEQMMRLSVAKLIKDPALYNVLSDFGMTDGSQAVLRDECQAELTRMSNAYIDRYTSLKDLLYKNVFGLRSHATNYQLQRILVVNVNNEKSEQELTLLLKEYPNYAPLLRRSYRYALQQNAIMQKADNALQAIAQYVLSDDSVTRVMPELCIETILNMVSMEDLHNLVIAAFGKMC